MRKRPDPDRVASLFWEALQVAAPERDRLLDEACCEEPALRAEVASLLEASEREAPVPGELDPERAGALLAAMEEVATAEGRRIGPYRVVAELGRGGMGVVYLAERADGAFEQTVAVKVLPAATATQALRERFLLERRILARLEHPGIARLLDGGLTEDGEPYFVMERVEGEPLTAWCDARRLSVEERLRLFLEVCDVVRFAHGRLVVHRDLKPSNILVTEASELKLLDFGIAKLLAEEGEDGETAATALTRSGLLPMTPEYAAPEQLRGEPVTVATDVYALGVLLYELLTGRRPHRVDRRMTETPGQLPPPTRPSMTVGRGGKRGKVGEGKELDPKETARRRGTRMERLRRRLRGDLDAIVLQALREEPGQRYGSVEALAEEIRRHLGGQPVKARPPSLRYRAGKLIRRHTLQVVAVSAVILALLAGAGFAAVGLVRARAAEGEARVEAETARQVTDFLVELFDVSDPSEARGLTITARELLQRGNERIDELADRPLVVGRLKHTLGRVHTNLGLYEDAAPLLEASISTLRRAASPAAETELTTALHNLGVLYDIQGRYAEAERVFREELQRAETAAAVDEESLGRALNSLAVVRWNQGDYAETGSLLERALEIRERQYGPESLEVSRTLNNLATLAHSQGNLEDAVAKFVRALEILRKTAGPDHPNLAGALNNLGSVYQQQERFQEARHAFEEALEIWKRVLGEDHPDVGIVLHNLGDLARAEGDMPRALLFYERSRGIFLQGLGADHVYVATSYQAEAAARRALGEAETAEALYRRSIETWERAVGSEHPGLTEALEGLASLLAEIGHSAEAERVRHRLAEIASAGDG